MIHGTWISKAGMCELSQLTVFYKTNRNWGLLSLSAGKLFYSEYIVSYGYNVTGNGGRDMHSERMPAMAGKYTVGHMGNLSDVSCGKGLNHQSAAEPLSLVCQIWKCSQTVNDSESEMACKRQSIPRRKTCPWLGKTKRVMPLFYFLIATMWS